MQHRIHQMPLLSTTTKAGCAALLGSMLVLMLACSRDDSASSTPPATSNDMVETDAVANEGESHSSEQQVGEAQAKDQAEDAESLAGSQDLAVNDDDEALSDETVAEYVPEIILPSQQYDLAEEDHQLVWLPQQGHAQAAQDAISLMDMPQALEQVRRLAQDTIAGNDLAAIAAARDHLKAMQFQVHNMSVRLGPHWSKMELQAFLVTHRIDDLFHLDQQLRQRQAEITRTALLWP